MNLPYAQPFDLLEAWMAKAIETEPRVPDAMQLATVGADGRPQVRTVLLKDFGPEVGLVFYTNYGSRKAHALESSGSAAVCLHWKDIARQVIIEGDVKRTEPTVSDAYFASRDRGSQLGAWASRQSEVMTPEAIAARFEKYQVTFADRPVIRPQFWGGYRLIPNRFEFWTDKPSRLHDRALYVRDGDGWQTSTLYP